MNLTLKRTEFAEDGVWGTLLDEFNRRIAFTLEHSYDGKQKLPPGEYTCYRGMHLLKSSAKPFETFEVINVPKHTGILFHVGNYEGDSSGCILLGLSRYGSMLKFSRMAFMDFMEAQAGVNEFKLTVSD